MFQQLGERVREEAEIEKDYQHTQGYDEALGMSSTIKDYLNPKPTVSKFDVDAGKVKEDNSLNPLGGKNYRKREFRAFFVLKGENRYCVNRIFIRTVFVVFRNIVIFVSKKRENKC